CKECKTEYEPESHEVPPDFPGAGGRLRLWKGAGCRACRQTGFSGRCGIFGLMVTGDTIRDMCVQRVNASVIRNQALTEGMVTLRRDGWGKVLSGVTTIDEVARVTAGDVVVSSLELSDRLVTVHCAACRSPVKLPAEKAGEPFRCPECGHDSSTAPAGNGQTPGTNDFNLSIDKDPAD